MVKDSFLPDSLLEGLPPSPITVFESLADEITEKTKGLVVADVSTERVGDGFGLELNLYSSSIDYTERILNAFVPYSQYPCQVEIHALGGTRNCESHPELVETLVEFTSNPSFLKNLTGLLSMALATPQGRRAMQRAKGAPISHAPAEDEYDPFADETQ
ncbi:MAG: hypothetical protein EON58_11325 [Alphaproteobacteria bacterium]|nr:MAG: hypothetical protein EON58_11325 [Alphaproteobacteria bacterium]